MSRGVSEEAPKLVSGPCLRHRRFRSGKLHMVGRVPGEDPLADGIFEGLVQRRMGVLDCGRRQAPARQLAVERRESGRCEVPESDRTDSLDSPFDVPPVPVQGRLSEPLTTRQPMG